VAVSCSRETDGYHQVIADSYEEQLAYKAKLFASSDALTRASVSRCTRTWPVFHFFQWLTCAHPSYLIQYSAA